jgi:hypothetical protein
MAIKTTTKPGMTFTKGSGQPADKANRKIIKPTSRSVPSRRAFHRGRLTLSIAWSTGLTKTVNRLKRLKSNCRFARKRGNDGGASAEDHLDRWKQQRQRCNRRHFRDDHQHPQRQQKKTKRTPI